MKDIREDGSTFTYKDIIIFDVAIIFSCVTEEHLDTRTCGKCWKNHIRRYVDLTYAFTHSGYITSFNVSRV